jgi:outer membrane protein TolC
VTAAAIAAIAALLPLAGGQEPAHDHRHGQPLRAEPPGSPDAPLSGPVTLEMVLERVVARNPELGEEQARSGASRALAGAAGRLPAPQLVGQLWQVPLDHPLDLGAANMLMLGLRQSIPSPSARAAQGRAAEAGADAGREAVERRRLELVARARRAFAAYAHAAREEEIHLRHVDLSQQIVALARGRFGAGRMSKRDLLRTTFELSRLHVDVTGVQALEASSRALLNALMGRHPDAPLGPPVSPARAPELEPAALDALADRRPDVREAAARVTAAEAALEAARREAGWPGLMVGADYGYMPVDGTHTYTAMVGLDLPWLWGSRRPEVAGAAAELEAARRGLQASRSRALLELREAGARLRAARDALDVLDQDLVPQARRGAEEAQSEFVSAQGEAVAALEALHDELSVRLQRSQALQMLEDAEADLDLAAGLPATSPRGAPP